MQIVEFNYIKKIFPLICVSKYFFLNFNEQPNIKNLEITLSLTDNKQKPEILFWFLFSINNKKNFLNYTHKKKYLEGKSIFTKSFLKISKKFGAKKKIIYVLIKTYQNVLFHSKEITLLKSFPLNKNKKIKTFKFFDIKFEEKFNGLINLSPKNWLNFHANFLIKPSFLNGYHFRFFLQNIQLPIL